MSTVSRARNTTAPNTRRIGWRSCRRCIASPGSESGKPQSQAGAAAQSRARRSDGSRAPPAMPETAMNTKHQQAVVGAAALGDRHDREPGACRPAPACAPPTSAATTGASASMNRPGQDAGEQAERREDEHRGEREAVDLLRAPRPPACAGGRGTRCRRPSRSRPRRAPPTAPAARRPPGTSSFSPHCGSCGLSRIAWKVSHSETKPLSGGSAEIADAADQERERRLRHAVDQAAELLHVALAGGGEHRAGAEEQQALEQRMVEHVKQRRGQRQRRRQPACRWP